MRTQQLHVEHNILLTFIAAVLAEYDVVFHTYCPRAHAGTQSVLRNLKD